MNRLQVVLSSRWAYVGAAVCLVVGFETQFAAPAVAAALTAAAVSYFLFVTTNWGGARERLQASWARPRAMLAVTVAGVAVGLITFVAALLRLS